jgi:transcriptional regulator with XRE-family HTH domain
MDQPYYWWYAYGHFDAGENNGPHLGQVIKHYRKMSGTSKADLAAALPCTIRYVEMMESDKNISMPELISRRKLLAQVLQIPSVLLGLSSLVVADEVKIDPALYPLLEHDPLDIRRIAFYEGVLTLSWEAYYTSSIERAAKNITFCLELLDDEVKNATGVQHDQLDAMRSKFYRLAALVSRECAQIDAASEQINTSFSLASRLRNAELIASSLIGRIRIRYHKQEYEGALADAEDACVYADAGVLRDPLKGKCYQMAGEAQAYLAEDSRTLQEKSLAYFDKAGRVVRKGNMQPDSSFVKTDLTSIHIERAKALRIFRRYDEAHDAFAVARKKLSPELTRWNVNLLIEEAKTYCAERDVTSCCSTLADAVPLVRAINLQNRMHVMQSLLAECKELEPTNRAALHLDKVLRQVATMSA